MVKDPNGANSGGKRRQHVRLALAFLQVLGLVLVSQYLWSSKVEDINVSINSVSSRNRQNNRAIFEVHNETRSFNLSAISGMLIGGEAAEILRHTLEELDSEKAKRQELEAMVQELKGELKLMQDKGKSEVAASLEERKSGEEEKEKEEPRNEVPPDEEKEEPAVEEPQNEVQPEEEEVKEQAATVEEEEKEKGPRKEVKSDEEKEEPTVEEEEATPEEAATETELATDEISVLQVPMQNMSIMEYRACCGLGHRLARQSGAYHAAHRLGFKLEVVWPGCGRLNVWEQLFSPETEEDLAYVNSTHERYSVGNEVPGYHNANKNCLPEELESNFDFYSNMKRRFKQHALVDSFVKKHFEGRYAIGIHIRAGNGETGDFTNKKRGMKVTPEEYTQRLTKNIHDFLQRTNNTLPPVLFVATDTASYIERLRTELEGVMPVVAWNQEHEAEGEGVFAGQGQKEATNEQCLQKWSDMLHDMMLLASTDLLLAGQFSSFSQAMPMSLVMGRDPFEGNGQESYCEVIKDGLEFACYSNKVHWCKHARHANSLKTLNVKGGQWPHFMKTMKESPQYSNMLQQ